MKKVTLVDEKCRVLGETSVEDHVRVLVLQGQAYVRGTGGRSREFMACETHHLNGIAKVAA